MKLQRLLRNSATLAFCFLSVNAFHVAQAGTITFTNQQVDLSGGGFGNILQILAVQAQGNGTEESGSILRSGGVDVSSGDATNQAQTISVADLATKGITSTDTFGLIFNINEAVDTEVVLHDFSMTFTDDAGTALFGDITYSPPGGEITLDEVNGGQGGSGWLFRVNLTPAEETALFASSTNRIGMYITTDNAIEMVSAGAEGFHVYRVPEPLTLPIVLTGLIAALPLRRRTRLRRGF